MNTIDILLEANPSTIEEYSRHVLLVLASMVAEPELASFAALTHKLTELTGLVGRFAASGVMSQMYLVVQANFDPLVVAINKFQTLHLPVAVTCIRFLTALIMLLTYWEVYNLLQWKPAVYLFLQLIDYDFDTSYQLFLVAYRNQEKGTPKDLGSLSQASLDDDDDGDANESDEWSGEKRRRLRRTLLARKKLLVTLKSHNYDPDVVHECTLPLADEPDKPCLRRFLRKYELIRHQETVHLKKKKLFKCFVCVKQNPSVGPRIFTRHDTLAKHIRVNHKILGKEAKAEVAFSKSHAEVVDEDDITVHVGRRKTKVDFEMRAHIERAEAEDEAYFRGYEQ